MVRTVAISDLTVSDRPEDVLVTYSLGSCIGLTLYDPVEHVGGLIHCMLPLSKIDPEKAETAPQMFTDTGVPALIRQVLDMGAQKERLVAKVAGAAGLLDDKGAFKIGERNYIVLRQILWNHNIRIAAEDTGGTATRTMCLELGTGRVLVRARGEEKELA